VGGQDLAHFDPVRALAAQGIQPVDAGPVGLAQVLFSGFQQFRPLPLGLFLGERVEAGDQALPG
jgi:hypothetical protein